MMRGALRLAADPAELLLDPCAEAASSAAGVSVGRDPHDAH